MTEGYVGAKFESATRSRYNVQASTSLCTRLVINQLAKSRRNEVGAKAGILALIEPRLSERPRVTSFAACDCILYQNTNHTTNVR